VKFLSLIGLLTAFGLAVPLAGALPPENETPPVNVSFPAADGSSALPQAQTQSTPKNETPGEVDVNPKLPEESPNAQQPAPSQTTPNTSTPAVPPPIGAVENPPLPKTYKPGDPIRHIGTAGSTYIPMDSWMYPALDRLSSLGYIDTAFFSLRPWTRLSVAHMLEATEAKLDANPKDVTAREIYDSLMRELLPDLRAPLYDARIGTVYGGMLQIGGEPLNDSFHFGQTIINNYGRPYGEGFNMNLGGSARGKAGRFSFDVRGEYQHAPSIPPYSLELQQKIANGDGIPFVPSTGTDAKNQFRVMDAYGAYYIWGMELSVGKSDMWWGTPQGGAMIYSNNAESLYTVRINRVEPLYIPWFSKVFGTVRFDNFFGGPMFGHDNPKDPWLLGNKLSLHPTQNIEFGFSRTVEFAGKDYQPLTFGTFWKALTCICDAYTAGARQFDVGDRRGEFDFRWRLPGLRKSLTIYADSIADDDPSPLANFRRAAWRPGFYLSHIPGASKFDLRFEAPYSNLAHQNGIVYTNHAYRDGYTVNKVILADWIGRDSTGYQAWLTYWINPRETIQGEYRDAKLDSSLWTGGGTQTDFSVKLVKRLSPDIELNAKVQYERWWIPVLNPTAQNDTSGSFSIIWYPNKSFQRQ
jgi:Capsule assembly protein Wzi